MARLLVSGAALITLASAGSARAQEPASPWSWTGGYAGLHVGAGWGAAAVSDPYGSSIWGDRVSTPAFLGGGQLGYNWQLPGTRWVVGAEADVSGLASEGSNTCLAYSAFFVSANCRVRPDLATTLTGRVGYAAGPSGRSLLYLKGGLAGLHETVDVATNATLPALTASSGVWKWGGAVGAGIEQALAPAWSMKLEYDYLALGGSTVETPGGLMQPSPPSASYNATAPGSAGIGQGMHMVKLGVNYRFGGGGRAGWTDGSSPQTGTPKAAMPMGWEAELGGRYWFSAGRFQKDVASSSVPSTSNVLNSRITYDTTAQSGELFGRVESPWNVFAKGFMGMGFLTSGGHADEDWRLPDGAMAYAYTNTYSSIAGSIDYATLDLGYDIVRSPDHKLGVFIGYNYYTEQKLAYGCAQIANIYAHCMAWVPTSEPTIQEHDTWQALRVGASGEIRLSDSLKLGGDVAFLPYVTFTGTDNHYPRSLVLPEWGKGIGAQLEAVLSYDVTPAFSIGVGGRYWAMWTTDAYTSFDGMPCPCQAQPTRAERYGVFLQASYRFAQPAAVRE